MAKQVICLEDIIPKGYLSDTHREFNPERTLDSVRSLQQQAGITRVADVTGLDYLGIPVVMAYRPNARSLSVSQGKGLSLETAKASAIMESIEHFHAESIEKPLTFASAVTMRQTYELADIQKLPRIKNSHFTPDLKMHWIAGYDLINHRDTWIPYELVHTDYTKPLPSGSGCFPLTSNGLASGNNMLEAINHALCEIIERDAFALAMIDNSEWSPRRLNLDSVDDPDCHNIIDTYHRMRIEVSIWDITSDTGIPCFFCHTQEASDNAWPLCRVADGLGCHPARHIALLRALTEAAQTRLSTISGARDDIPISRYHCLDTVQQHNPFRHHALANSTWRSFSDITSHNNLTFNEDTTYLIERLQAIGCEQIIVIDLTKQNFDIPVVRVVIPGLESISFYRRYCPGTRVLNRRTNIR